MQTRPFLSAAIASLLLAFTTTSPAQPVSNGPANQLTAAEKADGWKLLFDGHTTAGWHGVGQGTFPTKGWKAEDGWMHGLAQQGGDVVTDEKFEQFELVWEWKLARAGNSGLKYFVQENRPKALGHEYQILDDDLHPDGKLGEGKRVTAAFYDVLKPTVKAPTRPMGEINQSRLLVKGNHVEHWLNGTKVLEYECGSPEVKKAVAASKFRDIPGFGDRAKGNILLQDHGAQVWYRNLKIRDLSSH